MSPWDKLHYFILKFFLHQKTKDIIVFLFFSQRTISIKRPADASSPLDLSSSVPSKYSRSCHYPDTSRTVSNATRNQTSHEEKAPSSPRNSFVDSFSIVHSSDPSPVSSLPPTDEKRSFLEWSVDEVYEFVKNIDICAEYAEVRTFRSKICHNLLTYWKYYCKRKYK